MVGFDGFACGSQPLLPSSWLLVLTCEQSPEVASGAQGVQVTVVGQQVASGGRRQIRHQSGLLQPLDRFGTVLFSKFFTPRRGQRAIIPDEESQICPQPRRLVDPAAVCSLRESLRCRLGRGIIALLRLRGSDINQIRRLDFADVDKSFAMATQQTVDPHALTIAACDALVDRRLLRRISLMFLNLSREMVAKGGQPSGVAKPIPKIAKEVIQREAILEQIGVGLGELQLDLDRLFQRTSRFVRLPALMVLERRQTVGDIRNDMLIVTIRRMRSAPDPRPSGVLSAASSRPDPAALTVDMPRPAR